MKIKTILALLLCLLMLCPLVAFAESEPVAAGQGLIITEICYNPAWREGDEQIEDNADVFSYVEIYNPTDQTLSLSELSLSYRADDGTILASGALICAGDTPALASGEIAVILLYNQKNWTVLGLDNTADCAAAVWETFVDLHGIADVLDQNHLYIATNKEFKLDNASEIEVGAEITADTFAAGDKIDVTGTTKGRGFAGGIKRWGLHRLRMTHGTGPVHRQVGSMGANSSPSRIFKNKKMAGHYGNEQVTILNLTVVKVDAERNLIAVKGAVPGNRGGIVFIRTAVKA